MSMEGIVLAVCQCTCYCTDAKTQIINTYPREISCEQPKWLGLWDVLSYVPKHALTYSYAQRVNFSLDWVYVSSFFLSCFTTWTWRNERKFFSECSEITVYTFWDAMASQFLVEHISVSVSSSVCYGCQSYHCYGPSTTLEHRGHSIWVF